MNLDGLEQMTHKYYPDGWQLGLGQDIQICLDAIGKSNEQWTLLLKALQEILQSQEDPGEFLFSEWIPEGTIHLEDPTETLPVLTRLPWALQDFQESTTPAPSAEARNAAQRLQLYLSICKRTDCCDEQPLKLDDLLQEAARIALK